MKVGGAFISNIRKQLLNLHTPTFSSETLHDVEFHIGYGPYMLERLCDVHLLFTLSIVTLIVKGIREEDGTGHHLKANQEILNLNQTNYSEMLVSVFSQN